MEASPESSLSSLSATIPLSQPTQSAEPAPQTESTVSPETQQNQNMLSQMDADNLPDVQKPDTSWKINSEMQGTGEIPPWFNQKTFDNVEEQAKAYPELQQKFGAFKGAPKEGYHVELAEHLKGLTELNFDAEAPESKDFMAWAKIKMMDNECVNDLINFDLARTVRADQALQKEADTYDASQAEILKKEKIDKNTVMQWAKNTLPPEIYNEAENISFSDAATIRAFNYLRGQNNYVQPVGNSTGAPSITKEKMGEMLNHAYGVNGTLEERAKIDSLYKKEYS